MPRKPKSKEPEALATALGALDDLHQAVITLALEHDIEHLAEDELTSEENDDLPPSTFRVSDMRAGPERGGGVALDTRMMLTLDDEQAEALLFAIMRKLRAGDELVEVELDGRMLIAGGAARDLRRTLKEGA